MKADTSPALSFCFTKAHRELLRAARVVWDPTENGAPTIHPAEPFGSSDVFGDIARITELTTLAQRKSGFLGLFGNSSTELPETEKKQAEQYLQDLLPAEQILLQLGVLAEGAYRVQARKPLSFMDGVVQVDFLESERTQDLVTMPPPRLKDGEFRFTAEHLKLLRRTALMLETSSFFEDDPETYYSVPASDPKRPYGDMTYYPLDIASELGVKIDHPEYTESDDVAPFEFPTLKRLVELHLDLLPALAVFLQEAELEPGRFEREDEYSEWQRASGAECESR